MQVMKHSLIALAVAAASSQLALADSESKQSEAKGFLEGSSGQVLLRNTYWNQNYKQGERDNHAWAQGFIGTFESGFTQGTVGFGIDAFGLLGVKLDGGTGAAGGRAMSGLLSAKGRFHNVDGDPFVQSPADEWSRIGGAVKVRLSSTVLKYGEQFVDLPVLSYDDTRLLPQSFTGTLLTINEIEGLQINAGHFTAISGMAYSGRDNNSSEDNNVKRGASGTIGTVSTDILGASYAVNDDLSFSLYASKVKEVYKKQYFGANYSIPLADEQKLGFDFNFYRTRYAKNFAFGNSGVNGDDKEKTNHIGSLAVNYELGMHNFILAFQKSSDYGYQYDFGDGGSAIYLANSFYSDFNSAKEKSYQASYELNGAGVGVDGLTFKTAYIYGTDADWGAGMRKGKEREFYNRVAYTVQEGTAKGLSFKVSNSLYRANSSQHANYSADVTDWRLFVEYPLDLTF